MRFDYNCICKVEEEKEKAMKYRLYLESVSDGARQYIMMDNGAVVVMPVGVIDRAFTCQDRSLAKATASRINRLGSLQGRWRCKVELAR